MCFLLGSLSILMKLLMCFVNALMSVVSDQHLFIRSMVFNVHALHFALPVEANYTMETLTFYIKCFNCPAKMH